MVTLHFKFNSSSGIRGNENLMGVAEMSKFQSTRVQGNSHVRPSPEAHSSSHAGCTTHRNSSNHSLLRQCLSSSPLQPLYAKSLNPISSFSLTYSSQQPRTQINKTTITPHFKPLPVSTASLHLEPKPCSNTTFTPTSKVPLTPATHTAHTF